MYTYLKERYKNMPRRFIIESATSIIRSMYMHMDSDNDVLVFAKIFRKVMVAQLVHWRRVVP